MSEPIEMTLYPCIGNDPNFPDPRPEHFADPRFDPIWNVIKKWDINRGFGPEGATGNHVCAILAALGSMQWSPRIAGALFDFAGFLSGRQEVLTCSAVHDVVPLVEAVTEFMTLRGVDQNCDPWVKDWKNWLK